MSKSRMSSFVILSLIVGGLPLASPWGTSASAEDSSVTRLSLNAVTEINGDSRRPSYSSQAAPVDGSLLDNQKQWVAFDTSGSNAVTIDAESIDLTGFSVDNNAKRDVVIRDRTAGSPTRIVSVDLQSGQRLADSWGASVSSDGRFVAFLSNGTFGDGNGEGNERPCDDPSPDESAAGQGNEARDLNGALTDVYVRDRDADALQNIAGSVNVYDQKFLSNETPGSLPYCGTKTALVSVGSDETQADKPNGYRSVQDGSLGMSDDGRFVVFATTAKLVTTDSVGTVKSFDNDSLLDVYVRDRNTDGDGKFDERDTAATYLISSATANNVAAGFPTISADGRFIAFEDGGEVRIVQLSVTSGRPTVTPVGSFPGSRPALGVAAGATSGAIAYQLGGVVYARTITAPTSGAATYSAERPIGEGTLPQVDKAGKTVAFSEASGGVQSVRAGSTAGVGTRLISTAATPLVSNGDSGALTESPEVAVLDHATTRSAFVAFSSNDSHLVSDDNNTVRDVFQGQWTKELLSAITTVEPLVSAARGIRLTDIPAAALTFDSALLKTVVGAPAGAVRSLPSGGVRSLPGGGIRSLPGGGIRSLQLQGLPLGGIRSLPSGGIRSLPSGSLRSLDVTLSQLALNLTIANTTYTWAELLVGSPYAGWPLQSVTMRDLLDYVDSLKAVVAPTAVQTLLLSLTLFDIDPQGAFLQGVSLVSIFLGDYTLAELSLAALPNTIDWCASLPASVASLVRNAVCAPTSTLFALDLAGADLSKINLDLIDASKLLPAKVGGALASLVQTYGTIAAGTGLATYIMTFLDARDFPWENVALKLPGALATSYPGSSGTILEPHARGGLATWVTDVVTSGSADVVVTFTLPPGFAYVAGSAGCGPACVPDVTVNPTGDISLALTAAAGSNPVTIAARPTQLLLGAPRTGTLTSINGQTVGGKSRVHVVYDGQANLPDAEPQVAVFDPWGSGPALEPGTLYFADIAGTSEQDEYTIALPGGTPAGTRLSVRLSGLTSDLDLTVFVKDPGAPESLPGGAIRSLPGGAVRSLPGGAVRSLPGGAVRSLSGYVRSLPLEDVGDERTSSLPPEVLQDIPQSPPQSLPGGYVRALSPNRDNRPELIDTVVGTAVGSSPLLYTVRVTGYNDSVGPYALRVITDPPANPSPAQCNAVGDAADLSVTSLPPGTKTVILYPKAAIDAKYNATDAAAVNALKTQVSQLATFEAAQGRPAVIAEVTYKTNADGTKPFDWTTDDPCSSVRANAVAASISDELIDLGLPSGTTVPPLQYVVIIGGDDVLPMARVADTTEVSNETDYANSFGRSNPLARAASAGRVLTDNIYGDLNPGTIGDSALLVPELAVGRLVETPGQIVAQIDAFRTSEGLLAAGTKTVAAYDFLLDSGAAINSNLGVTDTSLINNTWNRTALLTALGANPTVISLNAHFDHQGLLTAAGNGGAALDGFPDQVGLNDVSALRTALIFSVGCHSGLNVPATYNVAGGLRYRDWADELSNKSALFVANTGFGYGDTEANALSEQLMTSFSGLIGTYTAGQALVAAKQEYAASLGSYVGYDEKVLHESTMYGLPMYSLTLMGGTGARSSAVGDTQRVVQPDVVQSTTPAGSTNLSLQTASVVVTTGGTNANGYPISPAAVASPVAVGLTPDRQVSNGYPIVPRVQVDVTADGDLMARGALITSMTATAPISQPARYARATVDLTAREPANTADDVYFPTAFQTVNHVGGPGGGKDRLVLLPGQYRKGVSDAQGTMTSFTSMQTSVFYGPANQVNLDLTPPTIDSVVADKVVPPAGVTGSRAVVFRVTTSDAESGVFKVVVLYDLGGSWVPIELTKLGGVPNEWVGSIQTEMVDGPRFIVQVVNNHGRVGTATDKGRFFKVTGTRPTLVTVIRGVLGNNGWYVQGPTGVGSPVLAEIYGAPGASFQATVTRTGSPAVPYSPYTVPIELKDAANLKDGQFLVRAQSTTGTGLDAVIATLDTTVKVDTSKPTISVTVDGGAPLSTDKNAPTEVIASTVGRVMFLCSDMTSGISSSGISSSEVTAFDGAEASDSCSAVGTAIGTLNTGAPTGLRTITATATDVAGNVVTTDFYAIIKDDAPPIVTFDPGALTGNEATSGAGAEVEVKVTVEAVDVVDGPLLVACEKADGTIVTPDGTFQQFAFGETVVTCTASDSSGNTGTGTFTVNVGDTTAPTVGVPPDIVAEATTSLGAVVTFDASASDLVTPHLVPTCSPASGSIFPIATIAMPFTTVTCTATDDEGITGSNSFRVSVLDTLPPVFDPASVQNIVQEASGPGGNVVTYAIPATDTVSGTLVAICNPPSGSVFPLGTTLVVCTATDLAGNTDSTSFNVIIEDNTPPVISPLPSLIVEATSLAGATVTYVVTVFDTVDLTLTVICSAASGATFDFGKSQVSCTATDDSGNTSTALFEVTVIDTTPPSLSVPSNITVEPNVVGGAVVAFPSGLSASDLGVSITATCDWPSNNTFALGVTEVKCHAIDAAGNRTDRSFNVTVATRYRYSGFYSPVNMDETSNPLGPNGEATVVNSVNGGRNVPLKFEVFENGVEITDVGRILVDKVSLGGADALGCAGKTVIPLSASTSKAVLKFDGSQLSEGWATRKIPRGGSPECWKVTVEVRPDLDNPRNPPGITAYFLVVP